MPSGKYISYYNILYLGKKIVDLCLFILFLNLMKIVMYYKYIKISYKNILLLLLHI